ncbi:hypothetical protein ACYTPF_01075 [Alteromonas sp. HB246098]
MNNNVDVALRSIAAILGGYAVSALISFYFAYIFFHMFKQQEGVAILSGSMASYFVFFAVFIASFAIKHTKKWCASLIAFISILAAALPLVSPLSAPL